VSFWESSARDTAPTNSALAPFSLQSASGSVIAAAPVRQAPEAGGGGGGGGGSEFVGRQAAVASRNPFDEEPSGGMALPPTNTRLSNPIIPHTQSPQQIPHADLFAAAGLALPTVESERVMRAQEPSPDLNATIPRIPLVSSPRGGGPGKGRESGAREVENQVHAR